MSKLLWVTSLLYCSNWQSHKSRFFISLPNEALQVIKTSAITSSAIKNFPPQNAYHVQTWDQDRETETVMEEIWEVKPDLLHDKYILNNNLIHAEMKAVIPNKKYTPYSFSSFFKQPFTHV